MAVDVFVKFEGGPEIRGESADSLHRDEIEVMSWSLGMSQASAIVAGSGLEAGRVQIQDFNFMKQLDRASPALMVACCSGAHFRSVVVSLCRPGVDRAPFAQFKFDDAVVSSIQPSGSNEHPMESVSLAFAKFTVGYRAQTAQGTLERPVFGGWDLTTNKPSVSPLPMK